MSLFANALNHAMNAGNWDESDYIDPIDGFRHCSVCKQAKQMKLPIPIYGSEKIVDCACKCVDDTEKKQRIADIKQKVRDQQKEWYDLGVSTLSEFDTFDADDRAEARVSDLCKSYAENWKDIKTEGRGLLLYGNPGSGKTFYANAIANYLINSGTSVLVTTISNLIDKMGFDATEDVLKIVRGVPLLVLDDFGTERNTEYSNEKVFQIINARYQVYKQGKPMIVTANSTIQEMMNATDIASKRICSRILEMCTGIYVSHEDRRKTMYQKNRDELSNLLNR